MKLYRDVASCRLVAVSDIVEPVKEVHLSNHAALKRDIGRFVQARDFSDAVFLFIPAVEFRNGDFYADVAFLKGSLRAFGVTGAQVDEKVKFPVGMVALAGWHDLSPR